MPLNQIAVSILVDQYQELEEMVKHYEAMLPINAHDPSMVNAMLKRRDQAASQQYTIYMMLLDEYHFGITTEDLQLQLN